MSFFSFLLIARNSKYEMQNKKKAPEIIIYSVKVFLMSHTNQLYLL